MNLEEIWNCPILKSYVQEIPAGADCQGGRQASAVVSRPFHFFCSLCFSLAYTVSCILRHPNMFFLLRMNVQASSPVCDGAAEPQCGLPHQWAVHQHSCAGNNLETTSMWDKVQNGYFHTPQDHDCDDKSSDHCAPLGDPCDGDEESKRSESPFWIWWATYFDQLNLGIYWCGRRSLHHDL